jgi:shikimate kinase
MKRIVLEGAPGQGKSTVTQYVCQVMRMQLLDMADALGALPDNHRHAQVRIELSPNFGDGRAG